ncbi:uncharacterized protein [Cherax quadricarinatus]|uniref:uncharacterized protein n=1 Tax=Cherax quadricarinatus TaxID=27406 RepID=UPI00387E3BE9
MGKFSIFSRLLGLPEAGSCPSFLPGVLEIGISQGKHFPSPVVQMGLSRLAPPLVEAGLITQVLQAGLITQVFQAGLITQVLQAVLDSAVHGNNLIFISDDTTSPYTLSMIIEHQPFLRGVGFFETVYNGLDFNRDDHLFLLVQNVKLLRQTSSDITIVALSNDPTFISAFVGKSLQSRLLTWSTRLLIITHSRIMEMQALHTPLSKLNAMFIIIDNDTANIRCSFYIHLPYTPQGTPALKVASWTPRRGLLLTSQLPLFPYKFLKFFNRPNLLVASEVNPFNKIISEADPTAKSVRFRGPVPQLMEYLSKGLNFTYTYMRPPDGEWGVKLDNRSWSGMVGMVMREETDIAVGPFVIDGRRGEVVDFTIPILFDYWRILGARGVPVVDPWSFLFPLVPLVWVAILAALIILATAVFIMSLCFINHTDNQKNKSEVIFNYLRILLQQDLIVSTNSWWERIILVVWMMVTLVLTRSYSGNLMALLAVRHIAQPYQTLRDVVDDSSVKMIWEKGSANIPYIKAATTGIYREIADAEKLGRIVWRTHSQFSEVIDTLVRRGDHVLMETDYGLKAYIAQDFTRTGRCSFYESRQEFLHVKFAMIGPKNSAILPALNNRITSMTEAGLFYQWLKGDEPNSTVCYRSSSKITVNAALSLTNVWRKNMRERRKCQPTCVRERTRFVHMWVGGMSLRSIALSSGVSVSTVFRWIHRWLREGNVNTRRYVYRPRLGIATLNGVFPSPIFPSCFPALVGPTHLQGYCEQNYLPHYNHNKIKTFFDSFSGGLKYPVAVNNFETGIQSFDDAVVAYETHQMNCPEHFLSIIICNFAEPFLVREPETGHRKIKTRVRTPVETNHIHTRFIARHFKYKTQEIPVNFQTHLNMGILNIMSIKIFYVEEGKEKGELIE